HPCRLVRRVNKSISFNGPAPQMFPLPPPPAAEAETRYLGVRSLSFETVSPAGQAGRRRVPTKSHAKTIAPILIRVYPRNPGPSVVFSSLSAVRRARKFLRFLWFPGGPP